jgi:hypothetical protein
MNELDSELVVAQNMANAIAQLSAIKNEQIADREEIERIVKDVFAKMFPPWFSMYMPPILSQLSHNVYPSDPAIAQIDRSGIAFFGPIDDMGGGSSEDYAFKVTATKDDATGLFEVKVLGGTAQVFGGTPNVYSDTDFTGIVDGEHIFVAFHMCDSSFVEVGTWEADIKHGDDATMLAYDAPEYLLFEIACVSEDYSRNVRQGHEGNIVMPAIANVVDVQTQLP